MNIQTANKLMKLRKEKGYTQESLADALGISRQAVSKWERAEASPDTDNLICLAKLYGVSVDELLDSDGAYEDIKDQHDKVEEDSTDNKKDSVQIGRNGIQVISEDGDEVHIDFSGIKVVDKNGENVNVGLGGVHVDNADVNKKARHVIDLIAGLTALITIITYILLGALLDLWHPAWIIFILIPVVASIPECFYKKKLTEFNYPLFITALYLYIGCVNGLWHPWWVLFITIPVFYMVVEPIQKLWRKDNIDVNVVKEYKEDDED